MANGREATILPDVCDVWIKVKEASALSKSQEKIAQNAYILMRGFANIGIIALVDEATGYQDEMVFFEDKEKYSEAIPFTPKP